MGGPLRGVNDNDRELPRLRLNRSLETQPMFDTASRSSSVNAERGGPRSQSMTREESSGGISDQFHMPGSLLDASKVT